MNIHIQSPGYIRLLAKYLQHQWILVCLLALLVLGGIVLRLINPQIIRFFIDTVQTSAEPDSLLRAALLFIVFAILIQLFAVGSTYLGENIGWTATNQLRADLASHVLQLDMTFHKFHPPGEVIERIDGDVNELANFFSKFIIELAGNFLIVIGVLGLLYIEDWRVGLGSTLYVVVTMAGLSVVQNRGVKRWSETRGAEADFTGFLEEQLAGIEDIRSSGAESYVLRRLLILYRIVMMKFRGAYMLSVWTHVMTYVFLAFGYAMGLTVGVVLYLRGSATLGTVFMFIYYMGILEMPIEAIRREVDDLQRASASIGRIRNLLSEKPTIISTGESTLPAGELSVDFHQVTFRYLDSNSFPGNGNDRNGSREYALESISFLLQPGRKLGLLGRTGSGKTTLIRLVSRLYDPTEGQIYLGDTDIRKVSLDDLRKRLGVVTQDVQLFKASLRDNITLFSPGIEDEDIKWVLRELDLWNWYSRLPLGLDTRIGDNGVGLSAGEAQLLAFARVFLKDPGLVILDEASSRLDPATEQTLRRAVNSLLQHRTGIIIAHRLSTVQQADDILILENGHIIEYGERERLAVNPSSHFYRLLKTGMEEALS